MWPSTQLVGRGGELARLTELLNAAAAGQGGLVLIGGEPGVGKTCLLRAFLERARSAGAETLLGCAYELEGTSPYSAIVEALRQHLKACPPERVRGYVEGLGREIGRLVPELAAPPRDTAVGLPLEASGDELRDAEGERYRLFEGLRVLVARIAGSAQHGMVLALDDLQWAGSPALQFLLHLARRLHPAPVLVVGTYRTVDLDRSQPLAAVLAELTRESLYQRLELAALSREEARVLIERVTGAAPAEAMVDAIYRQTAGNPFFTIEIARHACERQQDLGEPGRALEELGVPVGVQLVIGRRLTRLSSDADRLLQAAAVLGEPFSFEVLEAMLDLEPARVLDALDDALRSGFVREEGSQYHFSHALIREALYQDLALPRRQRLHQQAAEAIEQVLAGRLESALGEVAVQYRLAGPAADVGKAISYSERAGAHALSLLAYEEAASHWQAALALADAHTTDPTQLAQLLERLGNLHCRAGLEFDTGIACLRRVLRLYEKLGEDEQAARVHTELGSAFSSMPETWDIPRALDHYRAAEGIMAKQLPGSTLGHVYLGLAQAACWNVRVNEGLQASARALEIAEGMDDKALWADAAILRGGHLCSSGRTNQGFALMDRAWEVAQHLRLPVTFFTSFVASAFAMWLGDPSRARVWCERELAKATSEQAPAQRRRFLARLASAKALTGDLPAARQALDEIGPSYDAWHVLFLSGDWDRCEQTAVSQAQASRDGNAHAFLFEAVHNLTQLERARGRYDVAVSLLEEVMPIAIDGGELMYQLAAQALLGLLHAEGGHPEQAREHLAAARGIVAAAEDCRGLLGRLRMAEAVLAGQQGELMAAEALFRQSIEAFRRCAFPWGEAEALHLWGRALGLTDHKAAAAKFNASVELYQRLEAGEYWSERVRASQRRLPARLPAGLSEREAAVLRLVAAGKTNAQISDELIISPNTVARHVSHIFQKAGVANRAEAAVWAYREGVTAEPLRRPG